MLKFFRNHLMFYWVLIKKHYFQIAAAKPTPPKSQVTLTKEFPVSSGSQHRKKEADSVYGEWVPVEKNGEENKDDDNVFSSNLPSEVSKRNTYL